MKAVATFLTLLSLGIQISCMSLRSSQKVLTRQFIEGRIVCFWNNDAHFLYSKNGLMKDSNFGKNLDGNLKIRLTSYLNNDTTSFTKIPLDLTVLKNSDYRTKQYFSAFEDMRYDFLIHGKVCITDTASTTIEPFIYVSTSTNGSAKIISNKHREKIYIQILSLK